MSTRPPLSNAEMEVARVLWDLGEAPVRKVHKTLTDKNPEKKIGFSTVQTYLTRLEQKGYVTSTLQGRTRHFKAKVRPANVIQEAVNDFVDRLFGGESLPLVRHLISERNVSPEEIDEIRRLVGIPDESKRSTEDGSSGETQQREST